MADLKQIRQEIAEIAQRRRNVEIKEIEWVVKHLGTNGFKVSDRSNAHQKIFRINSVRFGICHHHRGSKQIKACYVDGFLDAMEELGLYEQ